MNRSDSDFGKCETCGSLMLENSRLKHENELLQNQKSVMPALRFVGKVIAAVACAPIKTVLWVWENLIFMALIGAILFVVGGSIHLGIEGGRLLSEAAAKPMLTLREMAELDGQSIAELSGNESVLVIGGKYYHLAPGDYNHCRDGDGKFSIKKILDHRDTLKRLEEQISRHEGQNEVNNIEKPVEEKR